MEAINESQEGWGEEITHEKLAAFFPHTTFFLSYLVVAQRYAKDIALGKW